jgi:hypothetical protein
MINQFYFKINLNKFGELKKQAEAETKIFQITALSFLIIVIVFVVILIIMSGNLDKKLQNRLTLLNQINKEIKTYQISGEYLTSNDMERLADLSTNRVFWAKKLVALAEKTTDQIAITHFSYKNEVLRLYGITKVDREQKEFDLINNFIKSLKENKQISEDFPEIKFVRSTRDVEKGIDIIRFEIDCSQSNVSAAKGV